MISSDILLQLLIIGFAALVHGAVGIGFPLIATPLLAMAWDVQSAVLVLVVPTVSLNVVSILKGGQWQNSIAKYWPLAVYGVAGSWIGTTLLIRIPPDVFRPLLAGVILAYLNADRLGVKFPWVPKYPRGSTAIFGLAAGVLGGTVNVMLPALIIFALEIKMEKTAMIQVFNFCFLFGKLTQGMVLVLSGHMTWAVIGNSLPLAALALAVVFPAMTLRERIKAATFRKWLKALLLIMSLILMVQALGGWWRAFA